MQLKIDKGEGELSPIEGARCREPGIVHLLDDFRGNSFRRIAIIARKSVENFLVPNPVLQHLRWGFDEIYRHMGPGESAVFGAGQNAVQSVSEFVKERFHFRMT